MSENLLAELYRIYREKGEKDTAEFLKGLDQEQNDQLQAEWDVVFEKIREAFKPILDRIEPEDDDEKENS